MRGGARPGAGRPKGSVSASPRIRQALLQALDELEAEGQPLSALIKDALKEAPMTTLKALAAFEPKERYVETTNNSNELVEAIKAARAGIDAKSS